MEPDTVNLFDQAKQVVDYFGGVARKEAMDPDKQLEYQKMMVSTFNALGMSNVFTLRMKELQEVLRQTLQPPANSEKMLQE